MDGGTFATGLAVGLFLGAIGGAFAMCLFTAAGETRQYRPTWPDAPQWEPELEPELERVRVLRVVPGSPGANRTGRKGKGRCDW